MKSVKPKKVNGPVNNVKKAMGKDVSEEGKMLKEIKDELKKI